MEAVLKSVGPGERTVAKMMVLYATLNALVKVNGTLSERFNITNGTSQGCPPSLRVYCIVRKTTYP